MMTSAHSYILALTSDEEVERSLRYHLTRNGYEVQLVSDVHQAVHAVKSLQPLLLVIDRRTKGINHIPEQNIFRNITSLVIEPPGSSCTEDECVEAVNHGFDFVICGESYRQLIARIRAVLRRKQMELDIPRRVVVGRVAIDPERGYEATIDGQAVELTRTQYKILECMMSKPMHVFTRNEILETVWGEGIALHDHTLDVHIHALRKKIERDPSAPVFLQTVRGIGYRMRSSAAEPITSYAD